MTKFEQTRRLRPLLAAALLTVLATCSSSPPGPPARQNDLCAIFEQRPEWRGPAREAARRWRVPVPVQMAIVWRESSFRAEARTQKTYALGFIPTGRISSAYGYAQAIDGTWDWYRQDTGRRGADRNDFADAIDFVGWYMDKTRAANGIAAADAYNQYLNYHEGHAGFRRGNWRSKAWLQRAAAQVREQASRYQLQLPSCPV